MVVCLDKRRINFDVSSPSSDAFSPSDRGDGRRVDELHVHPRRPHEPAHQGRHRARHQLPHRDGRHQQQGRGRQSHHGTNHSFRRM